MNLLSRVGRNHQPMVSALVRTVFAQRDRQDAHVQWREVADKLHDNFADVASLMDGEAEKQTIQ